MKQVQVEVNGKDALILARQLRKIADFIESGRVFGETEVNNKIEYSFSVCDIKER